MPGALGKVRARARPDTCVTELTGSDDVSVCGVACGAGATWRDGVVCRPRATTRGNVTRGNVMTPHLRARDTRLRRRNGIPNSAAYQPGAPYPRQSRACGRR